MNSVPVYDGCMDDLSIPQRLLDQKKRSNTNRPSTAVAYIRVSDESQVDNESLDTQEAQILQYAEREGLTVVKWFGDKGKSAKTINRRQEMMDMLKYCMDNKGELGYVIFYNMKRASRDASSYYTDFRSVIKGLGMGVRSATEFIDDSHSGQFMEGVLVLNGQLDNGVKATTTTDNMMSVAKQGWYQHQQIPGYDLLRIKVGFKKKHTTLKQNRDAEKIKCLFETYAKGGVTQADLKRIAKELGLKNVKGKYIDDNGIYRMLTQPAYAGYICSKLTNWEMYEGKHINEAIIDLATFQHVQQIINVQSRNRLGTETKSIVSNSIFPLKRFVKCFNCHNYLYASSPKTGGGKSYSPRYHCARIECKGLVPSMGADAANESFAELLKEIQPEESTLKLYKEILTRTSIKQLDNINGRLGRLRDSLSQLDEERSIAMRRWNKGEMDDTDKDEIIQRIDIDRFERKDQISNLESKQSIKNSQIDYAMNFMNNAYKLWCDADVELKQKFQKTIFPNGIELDTVSKKFGTLQLSPLYRYAPNKKDLSLSEKSLVVTSRRIELRLPG
jgi:site-specific DNA recombinase